LKKLTHFAWAGTLVSVVLTSAALLLPGPLPRVVAMSVGQGAGILALSLFLLAIALDLDVGRALVENADEQPRGIRDDGSHEK